MHPLSRSRLMWHGNGLTRRHMLLALTASAVQPAHAALDASAFHQALNSAAEAADLHSLLVWQRGALLAAIYRRSSDKPSASFWAREVDFGPDVQHDMRSITKSVTSLLVAQAVGRGQLDIATPVLDFYPELADLKSGPQGAITLAHLLDMASGLAWNEGVTSYGTAANDETRLARDPQPARYVLDRPLVAPPGTLWNYNGGSTAVLGDVLRRRTGRSLQDLARADLFGPMGITQWSWRDSGQGVPMAYSGLRLTPPDLLKIGQLMLAGGQWGGRALLPADWVLAAMQPRISIGLPGVPATAPNRLPAELPSGLHYGLQWWHGTASAADGSLLRWTAGYGNGGQRLFMLPALDAAVVMTAGQYNSASIGSQQLRLLRRIVAAL